MISSSDVSDLSDLSDLTTLSLIRGYGGLEIEVHSLRAQCLSKARALHDIEHRRCQTHQPDRHPFRAKPCLTFDERLERCVLQVEYAAHVHRDGLRARLCGELTQPV